MGTSSRFYFIFLLLGLIVGAPPAAAYDPLTVPSTPVRKLQIEGNRFLSEGEVRDRLKHTKGGIFRSGRYPSRVTIRW